MLLSCVFLSLFVQKKDNAVICTAIHPFHYWFLSDLVPALRSPFWPTTIQHLCFFCLLEREFSWTTVEIPSHLNSEVQLRFVITFNTQISQRQHVKHWLNPSPPKIYNWHKILRGLFGLYCVHTLLSQEKILSKRGSNAKNQCLLSLTRKYCVDIYFWRTTYTLLSSDFCLFVNLNYKLDWADAECVSQNGWDRKGPPEII